ncbi:MAG: STAS domain-containing protein, partial [Candidatus Brocadiia bacterium]
MGELSIEEHGTGDPHQLALSGRLSYETAPELRRALLPRTEEAGAGLILDLSALEFMDTAGLASLIEAQQRTDGQRGCLVL